MGNGAPGPDSSNDDVLQWLAETIGVDPREMAPEEMMQLLQHTWQRSAATAWEQPTDPLRLAAPPKSPQRYTLKVSLDGAKPPIWRRIVVPSDVTLDRFHEVLQAAMGWTNSHLHQFTPGYDPRGRTSEKILTDFDISEGDEGQPEATIRLDAMVTAPKDKLHYWYDFGDSWHHTVVLEKIEPRAADDDHAGCVAGRRACPPEDIGGIYFYSSIFDTAEDSDHPEHEWAREVVTNWGMTREAAAAFDVEAHDAAVRRALAGGEALRRFIGDMDAYPAAIRGLFEGLAHEAARYVAGFVDAAGVEEPVEVVPDDARSATAVIRTLLDHVGDEGVDLTAAGYLRPASVKVLMAELDPERRWIGSSTTEAQTLPLLDAREVITRMGLVRKLRGRLLLTKAGAKLRTDPVGLWWHVARRLPVERPDEGRDAATFLLLHLAAGGRADRSMNEEMGMLMAVRGWQLPHSPWRRGPGEWRSFIRNTESVLEWASTGRIYTRGSIELETPAARLLARGAVSIA